MYKEEMSEIERILKYEFKDKKLLDQALTRISYDQEFNNEYLEFVGDRVLELLCVYHFHKEFGFEASPAQLTSIKSQIVCKENLSKTFISLGLEPYLKYGQNESHASLADRCEDTFEAIIGAIAIDLNWDIQEIYSHVASFFSFSAPISVSPIIQINELYTSGKIPCPVYKFSGGACYLTIGRLTYIGRGNSEKSAKKSAALKFLASYKG